MVVLVLVAAVGGNLEAGSSDSPLLLLTSIVAAVYLGSLTTSPLITSLKRRFSNWVRPNANKPGVSSPVR